MNQARERWRWLWGRHAVEEALAGRSRRVRELLILHESKEAGVAELVRTARSSGARVRWVDRKELDRLAAGREHQGVALLAEDRPEAALPDFLRGLDEDEKKSLVLVALDQIQDPHNLGAIARSAACLGARGLLVPERRSASVTPAVVAASAGAIERIPVFTVGNLAQVLLGLKDDGFWIYGADRSGKAAWNVEFAFPMVLVIGSEGFGMRRLVAERCDQVVSIPQSARGVESLNASCAASVLLYEISRRLRGARGARSEAPHA